MTRVDIYSNTPEDAAKFERRYGPDHGYDDRPSLSDLAEPEPEVADDVEDPLDYECRICKDIVHTCPICDPDWARDVEQDR